LTHTINHFHREPRQQKNNSLTNGAESAGNPQRMKLGWAQVAHTYNTSDQEDRGWKPVEANSLMRPYLEKKKNPHKKVSGGVTQGVGTEFKPQYCQRKKKSQNTKYALLTF
jgi:hypothetical protein